MRTGRWEKEWSIASRGFLEVSSLGPGQPMALNTSMLCREASRKGEKRRKKSSEVNCNQKRDGGRRAEEGAVSSCVR